MQRKSLADCRDLKAQNIFMSAGGLLKLGDFGVSKVLSSTHHFAATAIGTPFYMSPEICQNKKYDAKVGLSRKHPPPLPFPLLSMFATLFGTCLCAQWSSRGFSDHYACQ